MVTQYLEDNKIKAGMLLLKELDKIPELDIVSAMWYYYSDVEQWEFLIYPPEFNKKIQDQRAFYTFVNNCLTDNIDISTYIKLSEIRLISDTKENIIGLLKNIIRTGSKGCSTVRMTSNNFNGFYVEDILLYRNAI